MGQDIHQPQHPDMHPNPQSNPHPPRGRCMTIGIAGGTGSGKTTITRQIQASFQDQVAVLYHDNYYKAHTGLSYAQRAALNYDHPEAFDTELMVQQLAQLQAGQAVQCPVYDYTIHNRSEETIMIHPAPVIVVEGILIFESAALRERMDIRLFVDTDADVRIIRRILRDVKERGRSLEGIVDQYLTTVRPMHQQFVEPSRRYADLIIPEGGHNAVALEMVLQRIAAFLSGH